MFAIRYSLVFLLFAQPVLGDVVDVGEVGFTSRTTVEINADERTVFKALVDQIGQWWSPDHTVSGDATRLSIDARPQGCFCEDFGEDAGIVHLTVTTISPHAMLRLSGGLGPLGLLGVQGNMTWEFSSLGDTTRVTLTYAVGGYRPGGLAPLAEPVDAVLGEALNRLQAFVETGSAEPIANAADSQGG